MKRPVIILVVIACAFTLTRCKDQSDNRQGDVVTPTVANDTSPPTIDFPNLTVQPSGASSITLSWKAANDDITAPSELEYCVFSAIDTPIDSLSEIDSHGNAQGTYLPNMTEMAISDLSSGMTFYFNVIVRDQATNRSAYHSVMVNTP